MGKLYLIPNVLAAVSPAEVLPQRVLEIVPQLRVFFIEDLKNARRFLRSIDRVFPIDDSTFYEIGKRANMDEVLEWRDAVREHDCGIISEAGMPGVADPGSEIVGLAHREGVQVVPLPGSSSIMLALAASGLNGQSFTFHGYLPIQAQEKKRRIQELEAMSQRLNQTQLFIETPFRNNQLLQDVVAHCKADTLLSVAANLTSPDEVIVTKPISEWRKNTVNINKKPAIFMMLRVR